MCHAVPNVMILAYNNVSSKQCAFYCSKYILSTAGGHFSTLESTSKESVKALLCYEGYAKYTVMLFTQVNGGEQNQKQLEFESDKYIDC